VLSLVRKPAIWLTVASVLGAALLYLVGHNYRIYLIHTGSMTPTIPIGSAVIDEVGHTPKVGEVITFHKLDGALETHRLIGYTPNGELITKGDGNQTPDLGSIPPQNVVGHVVAAPRYVGTWIHFISKTRLGYLFDLLVVVTLTLALMKSPRVGAHRAGKRKQRKTPPRAAEPPPIADGLQIALDLDEAPTIAMDPRDVDALQRLLHA
jgi:signal peptidase I